MLADCFDIAAKQQGQLLSVKPHRILVHLHIEVHGVVRALIQSNLLLQFLASHEITSLFRLSVNHVVGVAKLCIQFIRTVEHLFDYCISHLCMTFPTTYWL